MRCCVEVDNSVFGYSDGFGYISPSQPRQRMLRDDTTYPRIHTWHPEVIIIRGGADVVAEVAG